MNKTRLLIALVLLAAIAAFFIFDLQQYVSLEFFKLKRAQVDAYYAEHPWQTAAIFLVAYIAMAALSIPGATVLTLIGGAIFGLVVGIVLVSFASAIGATLAFLASRLLLRDWVQRQVRRPASADQRRYRKRRLRSICCACGSCRCSHSSSSIC